MNELGILETTGIFEAAAGTVRLSGALNFDNVTNGQVSFNFIFLIDVETSIASGIDYEYVFQRAGAVAPTKQVFLTLLMTLVGMMVTKTVGA